MSLRRMMLFMLAAKITNQIQYFKSRVSTDLGLFEAESCIEAQLNTINNQNLLDSASLIVTPNAYKTNKLYSVVPFDASGDMTFTRATSATRVNAQGLIETVGLNIPRIDYSDSSCPSILVEPQRTNLILQSNNFSDSVWTKFNSTVGVNTPDTLSPDGTLNATKYTARTSIDWLNTNYAITVIATQPYTFSFYIKRGGTDWVRLSAFSSSVGAVKYSAWFNLATGQKGDGVSLAGGTFISNSITELDNGWYRITVTGTINDVTTIYPTIASSAGNLDTTRVPNSIYYIFGAQLEAGSNSTSYIPTTTTTVTRNADLISKSGISSLIGQTEGTLFADVYINSFSSLGMILSTCIDETTVRIEIYKTTNGKINFDIIGSTGALSGVSSTSTFTGNVRLKIALGYKSGDTVMFINGIQETTVRTNSYDLIGQNRVGLGQNRSNAAIFNDRINSAILFSTRLSNSQLQQLTTL